MSKLTSIVLLLVCSMYAQAQYVPHDGNADSTFGVNGIATIFVDYNWGNILVMPNDELMISGDEYTSNLISRGLIKLTKDGLPDPVFGVDGFKETQYLDWNILCSPSYDPATGKIMVSGWTATSTGASPVLLCRYLPDGTTDLTFNRTGIDTCDLSDFNLNVLGPGPLVAVQPDAKYIVAGPKNISANSNAAMIQRFNNDGSADARFCACGTGEVLTPDTGNIYPSSVFIQPDGKILLAGFNSNDHNSFFYRYNSNGTPDLSFGNSGSASLPQPFEVYAVHALANGRILAAGVDSNGFTVVRFNDDGTPDIMFGNNGVASQAPFAVPGGILWNANIFMSVQSDNKVVLAGTMLGSSGSSWFEYALLMRLTENGMMDSTFGENGIVYPLPVCDSFFECSSFVEDMKLQSNGDILLVQLSSEEYMMIRRYIAHSEALPIPSAPEISVYPNPSSGNYTVSATNLNSIAVMTVCDVVGRKLFAVQHDFSMATTTQVDLTHMPTGIYFLKVMPLRGEAKVVKLLKE